MIAADDNAQLAPGHLQQPCWPTISNKYNCFKVMWAGAFICKNTSCQNFNFAWYFLFGIYIQAPNSEMNYMKSRNLLWVHCNRFNTYFITPKYRVTIACFTHLNKQLLYFNRAVNNPIKPSEYLSKIIFISDDLNGFLEGGFNHFSWRGHSIHLTSRDKFRNEIW